jgi:hypothetical protein
MSNESKTTTNLAFMLLILIIGITLPFYIKKVIILRIFQVVFSGIMTLWFIDVLREKYKRKESINYFGFVAVIIYGVVLYLIIKKYK